MKSARKNWNDSSLPKSNLDSAKMTTVESYRLFTVVNGNTSLGGLY